MDPQNKLYILEALNNIFIEYKDVFWSDLVEKLSSKWWIYYKIEVTHECTLTCKAPYRLAPNKLKDHKAQEEEMLNKGSTQPSVSPYGASMLFVKKKYEFMRICIDYNRLN